VLHGTFHGGIRRLGLAEGAVDYVHEGAHAAKLPPAVILRVEALRADVIAGRIQVPSE
jgi:basic membrane protein A